MQFTTLFSVAVASAAPFVVHAQIRGEEDRRLNASIAGYTPRYKMTDHNAIDLDQKEIETQIALKTDASFTAAKKVYAEGGNSKSYAEITLINALTTAVTKGDALTVGTISGTAYASADIGSDMVKFLYATSDTQKDHVTCKVGGLPVDKQVDTGCLPATGGSLVHKGGTPLPYAAAPKNVNGRTLKKFSTAAKKLMAECESCPYSEYKKFYDYYGAYDYADKWVTAAFDGGIAEFSGKASNVDFAQYGLIGRGECAKKGTAYMNNYMYVIREFEDAIDDCKLKCDTCNKDRVNAWDEGVAFYTGSLEGPDVTGASGKLLHGLADKRCANYVTCGVDGDKAEGNAQVNFDLFTMFNSGQKQLVDGDCAAAEITKDKIVQKMAIPLVQGTLRYAYKVDKLEGKEKEKGEGAVFAAAVLPIVNACSEADAATIAKSMNVGASSTVYADVKKAFENNYECMGISCDDIGQLTNAGVVFEGAEKCVDATKSSSSLNKAAMVLTFALVSFLM